MHVVLVDDHALFREGFKLLLRRLWGDALSATEVSSAEDGLALPSNLLADLIFLDLGLPGLNGLDGLRAFRKRFPATAIVVLSGVSGPEVVRQALAYGAQAYIPKAVSAEQMMESLRRVMAGEIVAPPSSMASAQGPALTPRQMEVLGEICLGRSNREISAQLGMSENTVRVHVAHLFQALGVESRTGAALEAKRRGLF